MFVCAYVLLPLCRRRGMAMVGWDLRGSDRATSMDKCWAYEFDSLPEGSIAEVLDCCNHGNNCMSNYVLGSFCRTEQRHTYSAALMLNGSSYWLRLLMATPKVLTEVVRFEMGQPPEYCALLRDELGDFLLLHCRMVLCKLNSSCSSW